MAIRSKKLFDFLGTIWI